MRTMSLPGSVIPTRQKTRFDVFQIVAVKDEKQGLISHVQVKLNRAYLSIGNAKLNLVPGLAATAEIKTDQRRIIEFLLSPLSRRLQDAGRKR
jgi:hemolysin D